MIMCIQQDFSLTSAHAHINLLGWVSLALSGIVYTLFPAAANHTLAKVHFWLHNIGLPCMIIGLVLTLKQIAKTPLIEIGGTVAIIGIILFAINVLMNVKGKAA